MVYPIVVSLSLSRIKLKDESFFVKRRTKKKEKKSFHPFSAVHKHIPSRTIVIIIIIFIINSSFYYSLFSKILTL